MRGNLSDRYNRVYAGDISNSPKGIGMVDRRYGNRDTVKNKSNISIGKDKYIKKRNTTRRKNKMSETIGKVVVYGTLAIVLLFSIGNVSENGEVIDSLGDNTLVLGDIVYNIADEQLGKLEVKLYSTFNQALQ